MASFEKTYYFRPMNVSDAPELLKLVECSSGGLSSLQPRLPFLEHYIESSEASFRGDKAGVSPEKFLIGLFDGENDRLIGCAAVKTKIGTDAPFINFDLDGDGEEQTLKSSSRFTGATEVGSLFLHPDYRADGLGRFLAKVRYLLMAMEPWRFGESIVAELRGICGTSGSPLYDFLFKEKLEKSFLEADAEYFDRNPDALGDIVPIGAIETDSFPLDVKASLAQPHPTGIAAMRLLQSEGFIFSGTIDLFDAGPIMVAHRDTIRTIMQSQKCSTIKIRDDQVIDLMARPSLISAGGIKDFRAVLTAAAKAEDTVTISDKAARLLNLSERETAFVWTAPERETRPKTSLVSKQV